MITDATLADNDLPKRAKDVNDLHKSAPPIFVVGLLPLPSSAAGATMSGELSSLGTDTEGNYKTADTTDAATQAPSLFQGSLGQHQVDVAGHVQHRPGAG